jgi:hypothetical protein
MAARPLLSSMARLDNFYIVQIVMLEREGFVLVNDDDSIEHN